ncbi:MAG TPA: PspC domain-containing protein [Micromonosporaceae bacterium]|nr:PspC domain-containing protein [Micromonosporaceae bacterium]
MTTEPEPDRHLEPDAPEPGDASGTDRVPEVDTAPMAASDEPAQPDLDSTGADLTGAGAASDGEPTAADSDLPTADPFPGVAWPPPPPGTGFPPPPGGFPPGAGYPPPGAGYPPPFRPTAAPPGTGGFATRFGLSRPVHDRYIAGVCGAFARATNTDPVLWRVGLPVLTLLGGFGGLVYVLGWLLIPADGDSASPLESLAGRGWSSTSRGVAILLTIVAAFGTIAALMHGILGQVLLASVVVGGVVLLLTGRVPRVTRNPSPGPGGAPKWDVTFTDIRTATGLGAQPGTPAAPAGPGGTTAGGSTAAGGSTTAGGSNPGTGGAGTAGAAGVAAGEPATAPGWTTNPAYRAPYAPHGPYATEPTYEYPFPGLAPTPPVPPMPVTPPRPPRRRGSPARRLTLSVTALVVGVLAILDVTNAVHVPASAYFAAALATIGLGLIIGAFAGGGRGPITLGSFLLVGLLVSAWVGDLSGNWHTRTVLERPATVAQIHPTYHERVGQITLDLRNVNFSTVKTAVPVNIHVNVGKIVVELPKDVDVHVTAKADVGAVHVLGQQRNGINDGALTMDDPGADGPGGGSLTLITSVNVGDVEVQR